MFKIGAIACAFVAAVSGVTAQQMEQLHFVNRCPHQIELFHTKGWDYRGRIASIAPGATFNKPIFGEAHVFRHGESDQATLAELSIVGGKIWHDISIIPPAPGNCNSYENCKAVTGRKGFNVPMAINPLSNANGANCRRLVCTGDSPIACSDGYLFPDDTKTHDCPLGTQFNIVFCP